MAVEDAADARLPGLRLLRDFVSEADEAALVAAVDGRPWCGRGVAPNPELRRRTQQDGFLFLYRTRTVVERLGPLPPFVQPLVARMQAHGVFAAEPPNHLLVNEYDLGQGIMAHTDSTAIFGDTVTSLSLLSDCVMTFVDKATGASVPVVLPRRSLLVMTGHARTQCTHEISKDAVETAAGAVVHRDRRISLTLRTILPEAMPSPGPQAHVASE
ncbi:hypothetical protein HK105_201531 [Polyrhizophydium stewartii]|uniref:Fe2OG dioxygenase domain-containing protein n=1 Tax=Polyrhizophydium stewartii TaxID=2732419 RepID=A0ABR4NGN8_9FUNG|nr:hypothetical protein HK105_004604 [Polyrhizophydium stewartii]